MINISKTPQGTDLWLEERKGLLTGSNASAIGGNGAGLQTYCKQVVMEKYCNNLESYTNSDMDRGNTLEPDARAMYQVVTGHIVDEVGLITNEQYEGAGVSLDGIIGEEGIIEIKCMNNKNHFQLIMDKKIKSTWIWQMQMGMKISGRKFCHFIAYNPNFDIDIVIVRILPDEMMYAKLDEGMTNGNKMIKNLIMDYEAKMESGNNS